MSGTSRYDRYGWPLTERLKERDGRLPGTRVSSLIPQPTVDRRTHRSPTILPGVRTSRPRCTDSGPIEPPKPSSAIPGSERSLPEA